MNGGSGFIRSIAFGLLLALPATAAGRLVLDARLPADGSGIERAHHSTCQRLHDHEVCMQLLRTPWSPSTELPTVVVAASTTSSTVPTKEVRPDDLLVRLPLARSPPTNI